MDNQPITINNCILYGNLLSNAVLHEKLIISHIAAGFNATKRLSELGIVPGTEITIQTRAPFSGPIQIEVRGTRLALGRGLAEKIFVKTC